MFSLTSFNFNQKEKMTITCVLYVLQVLLMGVVKGSALSVAACIVSHMCVCTRVPEIRAKLCHQLNWKS